jgi:hypothetical protein
MSRLDDLPPDQRAALSLLLRSRKSYAEVAALLSIQERAVHDRAHAALAVLAPREARELTTDEREEIGDYVLGQRQDEAERLDTRDHLEESPEARAWADALAIELVPLAGTPLREVPSGPRPPVAAAGTGEESGPTSAPPTAAFDSGLPTRSSPPSSRLGGGLLLLALIAVVVVVVVVVVAGSGGGSHKQGTTAASGAGSTTSTSTSTAASGKPAENKRITLTSPDPSSKSVGVAEVLSEGSKHAFYLAAEHLPASKGFFYAIWLYNSPSSHEALSKAPAVGSNGRLQGGALLPADAGKYHRMLLTKETSSRPTSPGQIILSGAFALH